MGSHITKPSNKSMVDRLVEHNTYIRSPTVEGIFRAVDRAMYFDTENLEEGEVVVDPYDDQPWRRGNLHLSAPCIYAKVVEALDLRSGLSFLNLGSGTGYLNTIVGLLVGPNGLNHGVELHADVIEYAYNRLQQFKQKSYAIDKYDFSEPVFVKGNCLNLDPNSRYDRIYLGAACLPDLEDFMKKLVRPNGGILVMPYESHLIRYIRDTETEWRSEKLMDVNFTLMIRQDDNDQSMIEMPLAQAKSLKELCRISIRQLLRDKTNFMNPNLLNSDNISSRRMRKAKAERRMLRREERRSKYKKDLQFLDGGRRGGHRTAAVVAVDKAKKPQAGLKRSHNNCDKLTLSGCRCQGFLAKLGSPTDSSREVSKQVTSAPMVRTPADRIMTRSASRRLGSLFHTRPETSSDRRSDDQPEQSTSSRNVSPNEYNLGTKSSLDSSDSDDDQHHQHVDDNVSSSNNTTASSSDPTFRSQDDNADCARARPYVCTMRHMRPHSSSYAIPSVYRNSGRASADGPPAATIQRRLAPNWNVDPPSSPSSSDSSDSQELDEYDYIGRRVVLDWPGFLRIHNTDPASDSDSSGSTRSSTYGDCFDHEVGSTSEESLGSIFDNFHNDCDDTMDDDYDDEILSCSNDEESHYEDDFDIYDQDHDIEIVDEAGVESVQHPTTSNEGSGSSISISTSRCQTRSSKQSDDSTKQRLTSKPTTARGSSSKDDNSKRPPSDKNVKAGDLEPVARRLRSKRLSQNEAMIDNEANCTQLSSNPSDRSMPGCSNNETYHRREASIHDFEDCPMHPSRNHPRRRHNYTAAAERHSNNSVIEVTTNSSRPSSSSTARNHRSESNHSSIRHSSESSSADLMVSSNQSQGLFTGRVLIATALGTTLSLAAHHYHHHLPSTSRNGSFRLVERRAFNTLMPRRYHHCHLQQLDRKRKRHSSTESSYTSGSSTPNQNDGNQKSGRTRRRCACYKASQAAQQHTANRQNSDSEDNTAASSSTFTAQSIAHQPSSVNAHSSRQTQENYSMAQSKRFVSPRTNEDNDTGVVQRRPNIRFSSQQQHNLNICQHNHHHRRRHHHQHHHRNRHNCQAGLLEPNRSRSRKSDDQAAAVVVNCNNEKKRQKGQQKRDRRHGDECERYHSQISGYIRQLPLPCVLHTYLNYEREP